MDDAVLAVWAGAGLPTIGVATAVRWRGWCLRLAVTGGRRIILAEAPLGLAFPSYAARLRLWPAIVRRVARIAPVNVGPIEPSDRSRPDASAVIVFTDAARSRYVWCWMESWRGFASRYREYRSPGQDEYLRRALAYASRSSPQRWTTVRAGERDHVRLLEALLPEARPVGSGTLTMREALGWIRGRESVTQLGPVWKRVLGLRIVDLRCASGTWLISAATLLEGLYLAILDRVIAEDGDRPARKPPAAIVGLLEEFGDADGAPSVERFVRRTVTRRHLFGFDIDPRRARGCRGILREYVAGDEPAATSASPFINVRALDWSAPSVRIDRRTATAEPRSGGGNGRDDVSSDLPDATEELRIIVQSWLAAVDAPESDGVVSDMRKLTFELERRSRAAMARIVGDRSAGAPRDAIELSRALIETLAYETNATIYLRERDGCTSITRRGH